MTIISFDKRFRREHQDYLGTVAQGKEDFPILERIVEQTSHNETILFDISGFDLFGYSYSKQTIRKILLRAKEGRYRDRYFAVLARNEPETEELADALAQRRLVMLCSFAGSWRSFYRKYSLIGELTEVNRKTLAYIIKRAETTSGQMKEDLGLESIQAASKRISKLADERLVRWDAMPGRERNVLLCRRIDV